MLRLIVPVMLLVGAVLPPGGSFLDDDLLPGEGAIEALAAAKLTTGCRPEIFCPHEAVTRGEMATFLGRALHLEPEPTLVQFSDLDPSAFYTGYVNALAREGVISGELDGSFQPDRTVSRAEMAAFLDRALELPGAEYQAAFIDVGLGDWFAGHVEAIRAAGITTGCSFDRYCPAASVSREEMAIFLSRAFSLAIPTVAVRTSPLDGLPAPSGLAVNRRVIAVKIDNAGPARPQSGIERADAMIELMVEGGLSRMMALYLESDTDFLGPVRSVRPTDALVESLGVTVGISGGQPWIADMLATEGVPLIRESQVNPRSCSESLRAPLPITSTPTPASCERMPIVVVMPTTLLPTCSSGVPSSTWMLRLRPGSTFPGRTRCPPFGTGTAAATYGLRARSPTSGGIDKGAPGASPPTISS